MPELRPHVAAQQLRIALERLRTDIERRPVLFPAIEKLTQRGLRGIDPLPCGILGNEAGEFEFGIALGRRISTPMIERRACGCAHSLLAPLRFGRLMIRVSSRPFRLATCSDTVRGSSPSGAPIMSVSAAASAATR